MSNERVSAPGRSAIRPARTGDSTFVRPKAGPGGEAHSFTSCFVSSASAFEFPARIPARVEVMDVRSHLTTPRQKQTGLLDRLVVPPYPE